MWCRPMTSHSNVLFNKTLEDLRRLGARGGKAHGRNQRARRALLPAPLPPRPVPQETAAEASARLDAQFPWLRGAERRTTALHLHPLHCDAVCNG